MNKTLSGIYKSLVRSTVDMIAEIKTITGNQNIQYHDWDSRADENKLPEKTLIGVEGFMFDENRGLWITRFSLALSSHRDANLLNEIEILDIIFERFGEGQKVNLLNPDTGVLISELVSSAFSVSPMAQSPFRNYRTISIEMLRTANTN